MLALVAFWVAVYLLFYVYVGYPALMRLLSRLVGRPARKAPNSPSVTIVVAAFNEERGIRAKLENLMALNYPADRYDVLVASDGSTDATDSIVTGFGNPRVKLLRVEGRLGKTACQNKAAEAVSSEIIVFTDATTILEPGAISAMTQNFADAEVGCVAAQLVYVGKGENLTAAGGTAYWSYEIGLRTAESRVGSLIGASGCLYAVRKSAYRPIRPELISDFVIAMEMRDQDLRTVLEPGAVCFEDTLDKSKAELSMRVRVAIRSIAALVAERRFMNPFRFGMFAVQLVSHKTLRYAAPFIWILALIANAALLPEPLYVALFAGQLALIAAGGVGFVLHSRKARLGVLGKPYYFLLANLASMLAVFRFLKGERVRIWNPVRA
jgi:cellulose synthase/poly-beta-1,6-N-acetylglucosamine synthase-like glycosyltransferase